LSFYIIYEIMWKYKTTAIETSKKEFILYVVGFIPMLMLGFVLNYILLFLIFFAFIVLITYIIKINISKDFLYSEDGFCIVGLNNETIYKNNDIEYLFFEIYGLLDISMEGRDYRLHINKTKYFINISEENKENLLKYFSNSDLQEKEHYINLIGKKINIL